MVIYCENEKLNSKADSISEKLKVPILHNRADIPESELTLVLSDDGLSLCKEEQVIRGDFNKLSKRLKMSNLQGEMIVKACKIKGVQEVKILDATAGLGEDSFLLAAAGFRVVLFERDPVIAELLDDALERAAADENLKNIASRMQLVKGDSIELMPEFAQKADVVLLDPMFPERNKSSLVKKKFQLIHYLENPCEEENELLQAAYSVKPQKIVVKRPLKGPFLGDEKPNHSFMGKTIRYDVLIPKS